MQHVKKISDQQDRELDKEIIEEEVREAVWNLHLDKAPGPDGFTMAFCKQHWEIIKKRSNENAQKWFPKKRIGRNTKSSFLALIPKESNPTTFNRYRPISLCNSSYKILTKILANRMEKLLPEIILENQGVFVPTRQITDNVIIVQEAIQSSIQRKERGIIVKLDMANAFDRVNNNFLPTALKKFVFSINFIEIIQACISNPWIAPLINGQPSKFFQSTQGLRQGCLLSPFLYIIMVESLSALLEN